MNATALEAPLERVSAVRRRIATVDLLRGLLMILMALDHTRDFFTNVRIDPTDPQLSWPALFFTRWITHLCAPGFVALAGTSVYLQRQRGRSAGAMSRKLLLRGLWLIFVELAIVDFGVFFHYRTHVLQVIWALGVSMMVLALLQRFPVRIVGLFGFLVVGLHNLLDRWHAAQFGAASDLWMMLHQQGMLLVHGKPAALLLYPVLPWIGVMALGYAFGPVVLMEPVRRRSWCRRAGVAALIAFAILRGTRLYGDPSPFHAYPSFSVSMMSFLNVTKYPPSLQYVLATFSVLLFLFALGDWLLEKGRMGAATRVVEVYGRVPFFSYVVHIYVLHLVMIPVALVMHSLLRQPLGSVENIPAWWGFSLPVVYAVWAAVVSALYLPCRWFSRLKTERQDWWLSYL